MKALLYHLACILDATADALFDATGKPDELPSGPYMSREAIEYLHYQRTHGLTPAPAND